MTDNVNEDESPAGDESQKAKASGLNNSVLGGFARTTAKRFAEYKTSAKENEGKNSSVATVPTNRHSRHDWLERLFDLFEQYAVEVNKLVDESHLITTCHRPGEPTSDNALISPAQGCVSTKYWQLTVRLQSDGIAGYLLPMSMEKTFMRDESLFERIFLIESPGDENAAVWSFDNKPTEFFQLPDLAKRFFGSLIEIARMEDISDFDAVDDASASKIEASKKAAPMELPPIPSFEVDESSSVDEANFKELLSFANTVGSSAGDDTLASEAPIDLVKLEEQAESVRKKNKSASSDFATKTLDSYALLDFEDAETYYSDEYRLTPAPSAAPDAVPAAESLFTRESMPPDDMDITFQQAAAHAAGESARAEAERLELLRHEEERDEEERIAARAAAIAEFEKAEAAALEQLALMQAEEERLAAAKAEEDRLRLEAEQAEQAERERLEAERIAETRAAEARALVARAEAARAEELRIEEERAEAARIEEARLEAERAEAARVEEARLEAERAEAARVEEARLEEERAEAARVEEARLEEERAEAARVEEARLEEERAEAARVEEARLEEERAEAARVEEVRLEEERAEAARVEEARLEEERAEAARVEEARLEEERAEAARIEASRIEQERAEAAKAEEAKLEEERAEAARVEEARLLEEERAEAAKAEEARVAHSVNQTASGAEAAYHEDGARPADEDPSHRFSDPSFQPVSPVSWDSKPVSWEHKSGDRAPADNSSLIAEHRTESGDFPEIKASAPTSDSPLDAGVATSAIDPDQAPEAITEGDRADESITAIRAPKISRVTVDAEAPNVVQSAAGSESSSDSRSMQAGHDDQAEAGVQVDNQEDEPAEEIHHYRSEHHLDLLTPSDVDTTAPVKEEIQDDSEIADALLAVTASTEAPEIKESLSRRELSSEVQKLAAKLQQTSSDLIDTFSKKAQELSANATGKRAPAVPPVKITPVTDAGNSLVAQTPDFISNEELMNNPSQRAPEPVIEDGWRLFTPEPGVSIKPELLIPSDEEFLMSSSDEAELLTLPPDDFKPVAAPVIDESVALEVALDNEDTLAQVMSLDIAEVEELDSTFLNAFKFAAALSAEHPAPEFGEHQSRSEFEPSHQDTHEQPIHSEHASARHAELEHARVEDSDTPAEAPLSPASEIQPPHKHESSESNVENSEAPASDIPHTGSETDKSSSFSETYRRSNQLASKKFHPYSPPAASSGSQSNDWTAVEGASTEDGAQPKPRAKPRTFFESLQSSAARRTQSNDTSELANNPQENIMPKTDEMSVVAAIEMMRHSVEKELEHVAEVGARAFQEQDMDTVERAMHRTLRVREFKAQLLPALEAWNTLGREE